MSRPILLDYPGKSQVFRGNISFSNVPGIRLRPYMPTAHTRLTALLAGAVVISQILSPVISLAQQQSTPPPASRGSSNSSALLDRAKKLVQEGDPQGALTVLQEADVHGANASEIHAVRGICLALLSKPIESAAEFEQAIRLRPGYAPNYFSSGLAYATFNNLDRALERLSVALKLDPSLPGVRYNYALVLARAGKYAESEKEVNLELESKSPRAESPLDLWRLKARDAYYQKKWQGTIDAYRKRSILVPEWPEAYAAIGEALFALNQLEEESMATLEKATKVADPENEVPHALLGNCIRDSAEQDKATTESRRPMVSCRPIERSPTGCTGFTASRVIRSTDCGCRTTWKPCSPATMPRRMVRPKRWF